MCCHSFNKRDIIYNWIGYHIGVIPNNINSISFVFRLNSNTTSYLQDLTVQSADVYH